MTSVEERLTRDIAAVTEGVVVTETDLSEARAALDERVAERRRSTRRRAMVGAALAAVVIPAVGIATVLSFDEGADTRPADTPPSVSNPYENLLSGRTPTAEQVEGVWRLDNDVLLVRFLPDGQVWIDADGRLFSRDRALAGNYEMDGDRITLTVGQAAEEGCAGVHVLRASLPDPGVMRTVRTSPAPGGCSLLALDYWALEKILPTSPLYDDEDWRKAARNWPALAEATLPGIWYPQGGGHLLAVSSTGSRGGYAVVDESGEPVDRGQWSMGGSPARLTLTSDSQSVACQQGDQLVLTDLGQEDFGRPLLKGTVVRDDCQGGWAADTFVNLSP